MKFLFCACVLLISLPSTILAQDVDHDAISDAFEQQLLQAFAPTFFISLKECDGMPAEFQKGVVEPNVLSRNGTVYGQVFKTGEDFEIHYYHLWARDCGRSGHKWDPEHVSVLVQSKTLRAVMWYAAAHENTICDSSSGVRAADIDAEDRGALVWISRGKHASYFSDAHRGVLCSNDPIDLSQIFTPTRIINIGERNAPLNGAVWTGSPEWSLAEKMESDFPSEVQQALNGDQAGTIQLNAALSPVKSILLGGNWGLRGFLMGNGAAAEHGGKALLLAAKKSFGWMIKRKRGN